MSDVWEGNQHVEWPYVLLSCLWSEGRQTAADSRDSSLVTPLLPRFTAASQRIDDERKLARIVLESQSLGLPQTVARATLAGDNRRLRGIPVVARGVTGASPGTMPGLAIR